MTGAAATTGAEPGQRARILDAALGLVSELGSAGTSMRRLAAACGLNVATIYHYFPSKAALLRALVAEQRYGERLAVDEPPADPALPVSERFAAFFAWVAGRAVEEETVLRLLVGEGLRGNDVARQSARDLIDALDVALAGWLATGFPELGTGPEPAAAARLVRGALLALITEQLAIGACDPAPVAEDLAAALFP
ncbi:MAG TPA: TetR/AcrR family transcriptional regulator [Acidimicrobiales bacterium]|nr:TetR/AcrR family transcriptional regulator [Acidimicrobiales bacterium]